MFLFYLDLWIRDPISPGCCIFWANVLKLPSRGLLALLDCFFCQVLRCSVPCGTAAQRDTMDLEGEDASEKRRNYRRVPHLANSNPLLGCLWKFWSKRNINNWSFFGRPRPSGRRSNTVMPAQLIGHTIMHQGKWSKHGSCMWRRMLFINSSWNYMLILCSYNHI